MIKILRKKLIICLLLLFITVSLMSVAGITLGSGKLVKADQTYTAQFYSEDGTVLIDTQVRAVGEKFIYFAPIVTDPISMEFLGWQTEDGELYDFDLIPTGNVVLYEKYQTYTTYEVSFEVNGGSAVSSQRVRAGDTAVKPNSPVKENARFLFWLKSGESEEYDFSTPVNDNLTLNAEYAYVVRFEFENGELIDEIEVRNGDYISETAVSPPIIMHCAFVCWSLDDAEYHLSNPVTKPITLKAKYSPLNKYVATFIDSLDQELFKQERYEDERFTPYDNPPKVQGYRFLYWQNVATGEAYDFSSAITCNLVLKACYAKLNSYTVVLVSEDGTILKSFSVYMYEKVVLPSDFSFEKDGYDFLGWYDGDSLYDFNHLVQGDLILTAKYKKQSGGCGSSLSSSFAVCFLLLPSACVYVRKRRK